MLLWVNTLMTAFIPWSVLKSKSQLKKCIQSAITCQLFTYTAQKTWYWNLTLFFSKPTSGHNNSGLPLLEKMTKTSTYFCWHFFVITVTDNNSSFTKRYEIHCHALVHNLTGFSSWQAAEDSTAKSSKQNSACTNNFRNHLKWVLLSVFWLFSL